MNKNRRRHVIRKLIKEFPTYVETSDSRLKWLADKKLSINKDYVVIRRQPWGHPFNNVLLDRLQTSYNSVIMFKNPKHATWCELMPTTSDNGLQGDEFSDMTTVSSLGYIMDAEVYYQLTNGAV